MSVEAFIKNLNKENNPSNYEKMAERARELFLGYDRDAMAGKLGLEEDKKYIYLELISAHFRLDKETCRVEMRADSKEDSSAGPVERWEPADYNDVMIIYDILAFSETNAHQSFEYTQTQNLAATHNPSSYAGAGMNERYAREYTGRAEVLKKACEALNGTPYGKGDVGMRIPLFKSLAAVISFWDEDDEFPASINILVDKNILQYMHYETVWYVSGSLMKRIKEAAAS